jgi:hypothetical protein
MQQVLIYNGQLDIILGPAATERFLMSLRWSGREEYRAAKKIVWKVAANDTQIAGYIRQVKTFTQAVVNAAGHMVPAGELKIYCLVLTNALQTNPELPLISLIDLSMTDLSPTRCNCFLAIKHTSEHCVK